jgi:beta-lactam-binding protein with PASTA domain
MRRQGKKPTKTFGFQFLQILRFIICIRTMKKFFRFVLLTLVLVVVALFSALTTMRFAIHGREVAVPNLVDKTPAEARRIVEEGGFGLTIERQYYSSTIPAGKILSQVPSAGTLVRRGWEIRVAESQGPQRVQIPDVLGQSERAAEMTIIRRGLEVSAVAEMPWPADSTDQVLAQSPPPKAGNVSAPKISLLVASQPAPQALLMPTFVGQQLGAVTSVLRDVGLRLGAVTQAASVAGVSPTQTAPSPASTIASQNPAPGEKVLPGAAVNLQVRQ